MEFSHSGVYLLSVSRDRQWCLHKKDLICKYHYKSSDFAQKCVSIKESLFFFFQCKAHRYELVARNNSHSRIIWSCSWAPDDVFFVTGSRDKTINIWRTADSPSLLLSQTFSESVTAVAFAPIVHDHRFVI